jgi:uncharacterized membrane protein YkvA (DUF1232 family)
MEISLGLRPKIPGARNPTSIQTYDGEIVGNMEVDVQTRRERAGQRFATVLKARIGQLFAQVRTILRAMAHPQVPWYVKLFCGAAVLYVASPIQLIPNFIPIIGQMDDVLVIGLSIKLLKRFVPPSVLEECQNASRVSRDSEALSGAPIRSFPYLESEKSSQDPLL